MYRTRWPLWDPEAARVPAPDREKSPGELKGPLLRSRGLLGFVVIPRLLPQQEASRDCPELPVPGCPAREQAARAHSDAPRRQSREPEEKEEEEGGGVGLEEAGSASAWVRLGVAGLGPGIAWPGQLRSP